MIYTYIMSRRVVLSLHGIRTRGEWQKSLTSDLNEAGFVHVPLDYGFARALKLLWPPSRRRQVIWFRNEYAAAVRGHPGRDLSVIAHSLGTYLVTTAIDLFPEIVFSRVVLCGSIVRRDFPWTAIVERGQVGSVLNERGGRDIWSATIGWFVQDAGSSGVDGFTDLAHGAVHERRHPRFRHSDCFYSLNYSQNWTPFLLGNEPSPLLPTAPVSTNWRFYATLIAAISVGIGLLVGLKARNAPADSNRATADIQAGGRATSDEAPQLYEIYVRTEVGAVELTQDGKLVQTLGIGGETTVPATEGEHELVATETNGQRHSKLIVIRPGERSYIWLIK